MSILSPTQVAKEVATLFRKNKIDYEQSRYIFKTVRQSLALTSSKRRPTVPKTLSEAQIEKLFSVINDPSDLLMFKLCYHCALRVSALVSLKIEDIDLDACFLTIHWNKTNSGKIPFPKSLRPLLLMHINSNKDCVWLFESNRKTQFSTRMIQLKFKRYASLAGLLDSVSIHCLRHSCLSHLASKGMTSSQLQGISLHRSKSSLDSYVRLSGVEVRETYDQVFK